MKRGYICILLKRVVYIAFRTVVRSPSQKLGLAVGKIGQGNQLNPEVVSEQRNSMNQTVSDAPYKLVQIWLVADLHIP